MTTGQETPVFLSRWLLLAMALACVLQLCNLVVAVEAEVGESAKDVAEGDDGIGGLALVERSAGVAC